MNKFSEPSLTKMSSACANAAYLLIHLREPRKTQETNE